MGTLQLVRRLSQALAAALLRSMPHYHPPLSSTTTFQPSPPHSPSSLMLDYSPTSPSHIIDLTLDNSFAIAWVAATDAYDILDALHISPLALAYARGQIDGQSHPPLDEPVLESLFHASCKSGGLGCVRRLVEMGVEPGCGGILGFNMLHSMVVKRLCCESIIGVEDGEGERVNVDDSDYMALRLACEGGFEGVVRMLVEAGADLTAGGTGRGLVLACSLGWEGVVGVLVEGGVDAGVEEIVGILMEARWRGICGRWEVGGVDSDKGFGRSESMETLIGEEEEEKDALVKFLTPVGAANGHAGVCRVLLREYIDGNGGVIEEAKVLASGFEEVKEVLEEALKGRRVVEECGGETRVE
ncbi:hypothetical protein BC829DRAFT_445688 [Chytridium lagenaria]|nr:hypothetical protein BC829DRAFT_445688 [Chytridium lagenaria]